MRETAVHLVGALAAFTASARGEAAVVPRTARFRTRARLGELSALMVSKDEDATSEELAHRIEQAVSAFLDTTVDRRGDHRLPTPGMARGTLWTWTRRPACCSASS